MRNIVITQVMKRSVKVNSGAKYAKHIETMAKIIHVIVNLLNIFQNLTARRTHSFATLNR